VAGDRDAARRSRSRGNAESVAVPDPPRYRSGAWRKSRTSEADSISSNETRRTGASSNERIVAPGVAMRSGACVATTNCDPASRASFIMASSPSWLCGESAASGSSRR